ncbi:MAG: hypothetical protein DRP00_01050 [Candidatus Aenigmatarchaeota archaeon]|nr:MAG: hypothetical protein DRP00_01050 [Candidatus Aenigmarchaeota archaeon]
MKFTMEEVIRYDRMGFIPSKNLKSFEDYKQESREKLSFLLKIKENPGKVLHEKYGKKLRVELYEPPRWLEHNFKEVTFTNTWPGIITDCSELRKIIIEDAKPVLMLAPLFPFLLLKFFAEEPEGRPLITEKIGGATHNVHRT